MTKRTYQTYDTEPEESKFDLPSEKEHLLQVTDCTPTENDPDIYTAKLEVVGGEEEGRTLLNRINLDESKKSFYFTRLFLKAIGEPYKGVFDIDPDRWIGRQTYATVIHNGKYANIDQYNFDKKIDQYQTPLKSVNPNGSDDPKDIQWEN